MHDTERRGFMGGLAAIGAGLVAAPLMAEPDASGKTSIVTVWSGRLAGTHEPNGTRVWRGIPFAAPPVGRLRGRAPQPVAPWRGVRPATAFGSQAVQEAIGGGGDGVEGSEDCLYLNVWAPAQDSTTKRPVLFWIHGGGFVSGAGSEVMYSGDDYAKRGDLVFVSVNYRLNGFGFLATSRDPGSANLGLLDQIAALRWVRDNIAAFNGDPGNVTVMGESAGAMSIGCLIGTPAARGLFARAIIQSGGARALYRTGEAARVTQQVLAAAGLKPGDDERLLALPLHALDRAFKATAAASNAALLGGEAYHPAIDGSVLPRHPLLGLAAVPTMIGHCENEGATFAKTQTLFEGLPKRVEALVGDVKWSTLQDVYRATPRPERDPTVDLFSDAFVGIPSLRLADGLVAAGAPVWNYRFDYPQASAIGAAHGSDVPFTFGRTEGAFLPIEWTAEAQALSDRMRDTFIAFARTGNPQTREIRRWPRHDPMVHRYLRFDHEGDGSDRLYRSPATRGLG